MKKQLLAVLFFTISVPSLACDYHGGPSFGAFGSSHYTPRPQNFAPANQKLTVDHVNQVQIEDNVTSLVSLNYTAPLQYRDIEISFEPSGGIDFLSENKVTLTKLRGSLDLQFSAKSGGQHHITLQISATNNGIAYRKQQRIIINAI